MLKSQEISAESQSSAVQQRVTPEELARALEAIESRKQAEASRLAGTIPIADAITELHLDSSPDEIWAEVDSQRRSQAAAEQPLPLLAEIGPHAQAYQVPPASRSPLRQWFMPLPDGRQRRRWLRVISPIASIWVLVQVGVIPQFWKHPFPPAPQVVYNLAQIPDGKEVYADNAALVQVSEGKPLAQVKVDGSPENNLWQIVKIGGHVCLRGYVTRTDSVRAVQGNALHVYNDANSGELKGIETSHITLRVDQIPLQKSGGDENYSEITVPNFRPDSLTNLSPWH